MKKILTILSLVAIVQCSNVRAEKIEAYDVMAANGIPQHFMLHNANHDLKTTDPKVNTKDVSDDLMKACDGFHDNVVVNENAATELAKQKLQVIITEFNKVKDGHNINFVETAKALFAAGALIGGELTAISPELKAFYRAGSYAGGIIASEIPADRLKEMLKSNSSQDAKLAIAKLEDANYAFDSFAIPISVLIRNHKERGDKSDADEAEIILAKNVKEGRCAWVEKFDPNVVTENIVSMAREVGKEVLNFGKGKQMISHLTPKEIVGDLEEGEKVYILMKAAMAYLLENPKATAKDAVEAVAKRVKGENRADVFGSTESDRKLDAVAWLEMAGREMFQVGRFAEHVPMIVKINKNTSALGGIARTFYTQGCNKILPENRNKPGSIIPYERNRLLQINVAGDGDCGFSSTQLPRKDADKWAHNNYKESDPIFAPSNWIDLPDKKWQMAPYERFEETVTSPTAEIYKNIVTANKGRCELDFMWIINLLQRPGVSFVNDTSMPGFYAFYSEIFPIETRFGSNYRARPLYWWQGGNHFNALVARDSYTELAKYLRYNNVGAQA